MKNRKLLSVLLVGVAVPLVGAGAYLLGFGNASFAKTITECNELDSRLRFSCFRAALEDNYNPAEENLRQYLERIQALDLDHASDDRSYAIFGTNCHTFYHALGDFVGTHREGTIAEAMRLGPTKCTSGYMMGLFKRTALANGFSTEVLQELYEACRPEELKSCSHEIGHLLHDKHTVAILGTLDEISSETFDLEYPHPYAYKTFEESDLNAPFEECRQLIPEEKQSFCYTGIGHNLFLYSEFSPEGYLAQFEECETVESPENKNQCFAFLLFRIGINTAGPNFLSSRFEEGRTACAEAAGAAPVEDGKLHCYRGVGGGIGLFIESEYPGEDIREEDVPHIKSALERYMVLCEQSGRGYEEECFRGLLGTRFVQFYRAFGLSHDTVERLLPEIGENDQVIG